MRRVLIEVVVFLVACGASGYAWWLKQQLDGLQTLSGTQKQQLTSAEAERRAAQGRMPELLAKEAELDAVRRAFGSGSALQDYEALVASARSPSAEQYLSLAALRLLVKGKDNPDTMAAFQKALELVDWPSRLNALCAAQSGIALGGTRIKVLDECAGVAAGAPGAAAGASSQPARTPTPAAAGSAGGRANP
jgi:hypothetical protein